MTPGEAKSCVLLTGASSVIGSAIARALAAPGTALALHCHQGIERTRELARELQTKGCTVEVFQSDLTEDNAPEKLVRRVRELLSAPTALVNNAGIVFGRASSDELTTSAWRRTFKLNAEVPFFLAREVIPAMRSARFGRIVNISSIGVKYGGSATTLHYAASKGALETYSGGLARQLASTGICVNVVRPGFTETGFHQDLDEEEIKARIGLIPIGRCIYPEETAAAVAYLLSPPAAAITGETLTVAGGD